MPDDSPAAPLPVVVCVDDDPEMLAALLRTLRKMPIELISTCEPAQALAWVGERDVAVLVSDYEMPMMNGAELAAAARRTRPETVRVLMTGRQTLDTAVDGINQGEVYRYVQKPFDPKRMVQVVTEAIERHRELVSVSGERDRAVRRERIVAELESEHPRMTQIVREADGTYIVPVTSHSAVAGLGLDAIVALAGRA